MSQWLEIFFRENLSIITKLSNILKNEKSPYLQQHKDNPVDWFPWNKETLEKAKKEKKPIFLSVGYASCHWCHVMAHESFEDDETAKIMNGLQKFIFKIIIFCSLIKFSQKIYKLNVIIEHFLEMRNYPFFIYRVP